MSKLPADDQELVAFLRQYRPIPPRPNADLEAQLMAKIEQIPPRHQPRRLGLVGSAIATLLLTSWGSWQIWHFSQQTALKNQENSEIEAFLVNSWNGAIAIDESDTTTNLDSNWSLLTEMNTK